MAQDTQTQPRFHRIRKVLRLNDRVYYTLVYNARNFEEAKCFGVPTEVFYPVTDKFTAEEERYIRDRVCGGCPVLEACAEWGLAHERYGIWGGMTPVMRDRVRRKRKWGLTDPQLRDTQR
jgi:hypothetical protein